MVQYIDSYVATRSAMGAGLTLGVFREGGAAGGDSGGGGAPLPLPPSRSVSQFEEERLVMLAVDVLGPPPSVRPLPHLTAIRTHARTT